MVRVWLLGVLLILLPGRAGAQQVVDDIRFVFIGVFNGHTNNLQEDPPVFEVEIGICGDGLPQVTVTPPGEAPVDLVEVGFGCWDRPEGSPPDLGYSVAPIGTFVFSFQGTTDTVQVEYNPTQTTCPAEVTSPLPNAMEVPLQPVFCWNDASGCGDHLELFVDGPDRDEDPAENRTIRMGDDCWDPWGPGNELSPETWYELNINVSNSDSVVEQGFDYDTLFTHSNDVAFKTPEPGSGLILAVGLALVFGLARAANHTPSGSRDRSR